MTLSSLNRLAFQYAQSLGLIERCFHAPYLSTNAQGERVFGPEQPFDARWVHQPQRVQNPEGVEVWSQGHLTGERMPDINPSDRVTLPDGRQPAILSVSTGRAHGRRIYQKVFF